MTIDVPGALTVNYATITSTMATLTVADGLTIASASLTISGSSSITGTLAFSGGTLTLGGEMSVDGELTWGTGTLAGAGALTVGATARRDLLRQPLVVSRERVGPGKLRAVRRGVLTQAGSPRV